MRQPQYRKSGLGSTRPRQGTLTKFFELLSEEQRFAIQLVSADGAKWIASCVEEFCPNAVRCIDPFHVVEWVNEALSQVRIDSWHDAKKNAAPESKWKPGRPPKGTPPKDNTASEIKHSKYALGKIRRTSLQTSRQSWN